MLKSEIQIHDAGGMINEVMLSEQKDGIFPPPPPNFIAQSLLSNDSHKQITPAFPLVTQVIVSGRDFVQTVLPC